jgi:hypothetical protein
MTRFDFPGDDFTQPPVQSVFASGGFRGDLTQVGPDGCLYITQDGLRYDDGTIGSGDSLVRICPGFAAPPGVGGGTCPAPFEPTTTITGNVPGGLSVSGKTFIDGATIGGTVSVNPGADVFIRNAKIAGAVQSNSAHFFGMVGSTVQGTTGVTKTTGFALVGQDENGCTGNHLGTTSLTSNKGGLEVSSNTTGTLSVNSNSTSGGSDLDGDPAAIEIEGNTVTGTLSCSGNVPAPTNDAVPNSVSGARGGQCAAPTF